MVSLRHMCSRLISACWAIITTISFGDISVSRVVSNLRRVVERVISAVAVQASPENADWRIVERMCSESVREQVNIFGRRPRNTGALCSPLLSY